MITPRRFLRALTALVLLLVLPLASRTSGAEAVIAQAHLQLTFTGPASPDWEYFAEDQSGPSGAWLEIPGTATTDVKPIKYQKSVTVGSTYAVRMRARSTIDPLIVTGPSAEASAVIPPAFPIPGGVQIKVQVTVIVSP